MELTAWRSLLCFVMQARAERFFMHARSEVTRTRRSDEKSDEKAANSANP
jgi:hypothetical protein